MLMLCDLDGTLIANDNDMFIAEAARVFSKLGMPIPQSKLAMALKRGDIFEALPTGVTNGDALRRKFWSAYDPSKEPAPRIFPGVRRALAAWKSEGHRAVLVTARRTTRRELYKILEQVKLPHLVEDVFCQAPHIPSAIDKVDLFSSVMKQLAIPQSGTLVVGDTPTDMQSARICQIQHRIAVLSGGYPADKLLDSGATRIGQSIAEPELLDL
jgi:phosphoglycolate phosphatase-like HAD superfamily hydrolase